LELFQDKPKEIDFLINSNGGDGLTSWRLITLLREYLGKNGKIMGTRLPNLNYNIGMANLSSGWKDVTSA
jgi:hypothetical protein